MSRIINLRSPFFVKVDTSTPERVLESATLFLYVWEGNLGDRPNSPTYTLVQQVNSLENFITFEIAELARDTISHSFDGVNRRTDPVYIGYEILKSYTNSNASDRESGLVIGLDGYENHDSGLQGHFNYINIVEETQDEDSGKDSLTVSIDANIAEGVRDSIVAGTSVTLTATYSPVDATLEWFRGTTSVGTGRFLRISDFAATNNGTYTAVVTPPSTDDRKPVKSNAITLSLATDNKITISPVLHVFTNASGNSQDFVCKYKATNTTIVAADIIHPSWLTLGTISASDTETVGLFKETTITLSTNAARTAIGERDYAKVSFEVGTGNDEPPTPAYVTQSGKTITGITSTLATTDSDAQVEIGNDMTCTVTSISDPDSTATSTIEYQWYVNGVALEGASGSLNGNSPGTISRVFNFSDPGERAIRCALTSSESGVTKYAVVSGTDTTLELNWYAKPNLSVGDSQAISAKIGENITFTPVFFDPAGGNATSWSWTIENPDGTTITPSAGGGSTHNFATFTKSAAGAVVIKVTANSSISGLTSNALNVVFSFTNITTGPTLTTASYEKRLSTKDVWTASTGTEPTSYWIRGIVYITPTAGTIVEEHSVNFRLNSVTGTLLAETAIETGVADTIADGVSSYAVKIDRFSTSPKTETIYAVVEDEIHGQNSSQTLTMTWQAPDRIFIVNKAGGVSYKNTAQNNVSWDVRSNDTWTASTTASWISFDTSSGGTAGTNLALDNFVFDVAANTSTQARTATIKVQTSGSNNATDELVIYQSGTGKGLVSSFLVTPIALPPDGGAVDIDVTANAGAAWRVEARGTGLNKDFFGTGSDNLEVLIGPSANTRDFTFTVFGIGNTSVSADSSVVVRQAGSGGVGDDAGIPEIA